jgi:hypothetical protein
MYYFISIMCAHNVSVSSSRYICIALILCIHINYVGKELTVQDTFKRSCIRSRLLCGTNWACEETHVGTQAIPPPPPPHLSPAPCQGYRRIGVGGGGAAVGHLLSPGPRPHSLTALALHICQMPLSYLMGHPSMESTPLSEPWRRRLPRL